VSILKLTLQYDGTAYAGWQRQKDQVSVQGLVEDALAPIAGGPVTVHGAGRTDAGVHALGQIASVSLETTLDCGTLQRAMNAVLPADVRVSSVEAAPDGFHARFSARAKTYEYRIITGPFVSPFEHRYAWHLPYPLDVEGMRRAAGSLVGRHDFAAFQGSGSAVKSTEREVFSLAIAHDPPRLAVRVRADGFLRHMVRAIAGTLVEVGGGRLPPTAIPEVLAARDRARAGPTAPAHGLFLISVEY
jgi:tRNA pseudouridine38-40 synthase